MSESHEMEKAGASSCEPATQQFLVSNNSKPGSAGCAELVRNLIECLRCSRTDRRYSGDADHDNQGEHNGILNSGWAIFTLQKSLQLQGETLHHFRQTRPAQPELST
jgi:hypothetical protein